MSHVTTDLEEKIASARAMLLDGKTGQALGVMNRLIAEHPESTELQSTACKCYLALGKSDMPGEWISSAIVHDPSIKSAIIKLSTSLFEDGRMEDCLRLLGALVNCDPENHEGWNDLGAVLFASGDPDGSIRALERSLALKPGYGEAIMNLTGVYMALQKLDDAKRAAMMSLDEGCECSAEVLSETAKLIKDTAPKEALTLLRKAKEAASERVEVKEKERVVKPADDEAGRVFAPDLTMKGVVWYSTMKCNNHCPYCLAHQVHDPMMKVPFRDYREWVDAWNSFDGRLLLDITGGEPFMHPGMVDLINALRDNIKVAVTTNTRCDLTGFVQSVSPEKCISITTSLHPSSKMNTEHFLGKILLLKNRGFRVIVNYVSYPEQLWMIPYFKKLVEDVDIPFHVDPYGPNPKRPYKLSAEEEKFLRQYVGGDRGDFFNKEPVLYQCSGGMNFFSTLPNGDTYTCVTKRYVKENYVGNIFEDGFKPFDEPIRCKAVSCAGCDLDKVTRIPADKVHAVQV